MLNNYVNFGFTIVKKLIDSAHDKLVNIPGGHRFGIYIHACQLKLAMPIYVLKTGIQAK